MILLYSQELNIRILSYKISMRYRIEIVMRFRIITCIESNLGQKVELNIK